MGDPGVYLVLEFTERFLTSNVLLIDLSLLKVNLQVSCMF